MKRREMIRRGLQVGAGGLLSGGLGTTALAAAGQKPAAGPGRAAHMDSGLLARNIIFYAYDGFSWEDVAVGQAFARRRFGRPLRLDRLLKNGPAGSCETYSFDVVTDSAAAGTAWSTGRKTLNGLLNCYPDGEPLTPILEIARGAGRATGLITTTRVTHATPAAWCARVLDRNEEDDIALQYLAFRPDVLLGGGGRHFSPATRSDGRDLAAEFSAAGHAVLRTSAALQRTNASRLLGLFSGSHLPFEIDRRYQNARTPSLAELAAKGLEVLAGYEHGFVAQIEAGRIDHANHHNDAGAAVWEVQAADDALGVVLDFVDRHPDTLLILASDHSTGGGALHGTGSFYRDSSTAFERIDAHRGSLEHMIERLGSRPGADAVAEAVAAYAGCRLTPEQAALGARAFVEPAAASPNRTAFNDQPHNTLAYVIAGGGAGTAMRDRINFNYATGQHTAAAVPVALYGAGAASRRFSFIDNTDLFGWMCDALGVRHENAVMEPAVPA
ncbi:MAG: alkaline phosphatase [Gemmatimonadetes bacterium]|nr:alkaline phosphatase [Gemmatimonadota bacterium]